MIRRPPRSTRTDTLFPYTTLFRAIPDRIVVQLAQTPDGARYVSMATGLVKPSGSYARAPRRYAVALGCEVAHAKSFVYADQLDLANEQAATPIGISCRIRSEERRVGEAGVSLCKLRGSPAP